MPDRSEVGYARDKGYMKVSFCHSFLLMNEEIK